MNPLHTVKLIELTLVLAIETYDGTQLPLVSAMDFVNFEGDATVIGFSERDLKLTYTDEENK